ncbi:MAG TPA: RagB/SusD family nutrient uptake outer membrane protein [Chitinophagaceae bacterium]|nr:RagB/SusD family nutrient uptake outer membrane protein [Chitinophagaceae bacterium]
MKKFIKYKLLAVITFIMVLSSCKKDFLEKLPPTALTPELALSTESDLQTALMGAYAGLRATDLFGRTVPVFGDLNADNAYVSLKNSGRYTNFNTYTFTVADGNILGFWSSAYTAILRVNNIINSNVAANTNVNQYKGEAYAIRALCYWYLVEYFAKPYTDDPNSWGVPIVLKYDPNTVADDKPPRNKLSEVYALILADLNQAYTLMTQFTNSTQFSKYAAKALQAKVYLAMGDKTNAKTAALDVINNSGFTVVSAANYISYWAGLTPRTDKVETIFEVSSNSTASNGFDALANIYNQGGYGDILLSDPLYALFEASDVRKGLYTVTTRGGLPATVANNKFPGTNGTEISDTKLLRLSDVYLIAAEASLPGNETDAKTYANYITSRRTASAIASTGSQLFEDIITERRKELALEGDRYLDMQRLKRDISRSSNYPASAQSIPYTNFRRLFPIPQTELDANPNIRAQQNPGWF